MDVRPLIPLLTLALLAPLAGAHGPYTGQLRTGEAHLYSEDHTSTFCGEAFTGWTITLRYAPAGDTLTLVVPGSGASVGKNGVAVVSFTTSTTCASYDMIVHGTMIKDVADYTLTVTTGPGYPGGILGNGGSA